MRKVLFLFFIIQIFFALNGSLLDDADASFRKGDIDETMRLTREYVQENPYEADGWYFLGRYMHFLLYDTGRRVYIEEKSDSVIEYLDRSISISDTIGNAFYYIGVEYGMRGHYVFMAGDSLKAKHEFSEGRRKGGYPDWLLEYARNVLKSCDKNAILIGGGDAELNSIWYLQFCENYRRDVTAMPFGLLSFPPFVKYAKIGCRGVVPPVKMSYSDGKIDSMTYGRNIGDSISLEVPHKLKKKWNMKKDEEMKWVLSADMNFRGEDLIVPGTFVFIDMLKENDFKRPVYFTLGTGDNMRASLNDFLQTSGFALKLIPKRTSMAGKMDEDAVAKVMMNRENLKHLRTYADLPMKRCGMILMNYIALLLELRDNYKSAGEIAESREVLAFMKDYVDIGVIEMPNGMREYLDSLYSAEM